MKCADVLRKMEELEMQGPQIYPPSQVQEHLLDCESCRAEWSAIQEAWLLMTAGLQAETVDEDFESKVFDRIRNVAGEKTTARDASRFWKYALAASVLIALIGGTFWYPTWILRGTSTDQDLNRVTEFARQMQKLKQLENAYANPEFRYVSLTTIGSGNQIQGYLVYDYDAKVGHFFGYDLNASDGDRFVLWLLDHQQTVLSSAAIDVNSNGVGAATVTLPQELETLNKIVVSLETKLPADAPSSRLKMQSTVSP